jgi:NYN domain
LDLSPAPSLKPRVALLIDGDNYPRSGLAEVEIKAARLGEVTIRRVFGDMALHKDWAQETAFTATHCGTSAGKNRADMALVVAAMDFAHRGLATAFLIVSDDRDFDPLVSHMREQGYRVERIGKQKAPRDGIAQTPAKPRRSPGSEAMVKRVRALITGSGTAGYPLQSLGAALYQQGIKISDTPQKTWRAWLTAHPEDFVCDPRGPDARVRLRI